MKKIALFSILAISLIVGGSAVFSQTANFPIVQTNSVSNIGNNYATFSGQVNPNGFPTTFYFEFGQTSSLGQITPTQSLTASYSNTNVTSVMSGLYPNSTYYYRLTAVNSYGTSRGAIVSFTTVNNNNYVSQGTSVMTNAASDIYGTTAILHAYANTNTNQSLGWFEYGTDQGNLYQRTTPVVIGTAYYYSSNNQNPYFTYQLTGLNPNTTYYFRAVLESNGYRSEGQVLNFVTGGAPASVYPPYYTPSTYQSYQTPYVDYQTPYVAPEVQYVYQQPKIIYLNADGTQYTGQQTQNPGNGSVYQQGNQFYAPYYGMPTYIPAGQYSGLTASALASTGNVTASSVFGGFLFTVLIILIIAGFLKGAF